MSPMPLRPCFKAIYLFSADIGNEVRERARVRARARISQANL
jgi:hypothetical protein